MKRRAHDDRNGRSLRLSVRYANRHGGRTGVTAVGASTGWVSMAGALVGMDSGGLFRAVVGGALRRVSGDAGALRGSTALAAALLTGLAAGESAGQPPDLFREVAPAGAVAGPDLSAVSDAITLRRRLVAIDSGQVAPPADTAAAVSSGAGSGPSGVLTLNLFDDTSFTGLVQSVAPSFSGDYSLSDPLAGVEMGTMTLVLNGEVVAGTVRTPEAVYRIRPAAAGLHAVSEIDLPRLPPLGESIPDRGWEEAERPLLGPDRRFPGPIEPLMLPAPAAFPVTEDAPLANAQGSIATARAALETLYDTTEGANWADSTNWKTSAALGKWYGVSTDADGRVVGLRLSSNRLSGAIPGTLGSLVCLEHLWLGSNDLTGGIPDELGNLTNLEFRRAGARLVALDDGGTRAGDGGRTRRVGAAS